MNRKGFTIIELLVSFALVSIVLVFLLQIVVVLKDLYVSVSFQTELLNEEGVMLEMINSDFMANGILRITACEDGDEYTQNCYDIKLGDGTTKRLSVNNDKSIISYGERAVKLPTGTKICDSLNNCNVIDIKVYNTAYEPGAYILLDEDELLVINIPITSSYDKVKANDIRIVYQDRYQRKINYSIISFENNGGSGCNVQQYVVGETYGALCTPNKAGYVFAGWYREPTLENKISSTTIITNPNSHTIYAAWEAE